MGDSIGVLGLEMRVTVREVTVQYLLFARIIHPDKHDMEVTGMTSGEVVDIFKLVNNAQQQLRTIIRS